MHTGEIESFAPGPLIGVFINKPGRVYYHFGWSRYDLMDNTCRPARATLYFFSLHDIDYGRRLINGTAYDPSRRGWVGALFPFPDILYLRDGVPESRSREYALMQKAFQELKIPMVNSLVGFDKWEVNLVLQNDAALRPHLPETRLGGRVAGDLEAMLQAYGRVYLKGCRGRQGRQVMRVTRLAGGKYEYCYFIEKLTRRKVHQKSSLHRAVDSFYKGRPFIIQQPIDLIEHEGGIIDLRAEMQRNGKGELEVVAIPVRIGRRDSPITTHAASYQFDPFFTGALHYGEAELAALKNRIYDFLYRIYGCIEKHYGPFGEIGIDIGLDKKGKLWFIECNSQPAKVSLMKAYGGKTAAAAFANPLEYALYLYYGGKART